jgi:peptidoglycan/LPS O-acetylase OafA/YrhL
MIDQLKQRRGFTNFVRLIAAIAVLVSHSYPISGSGPDPLFGNLPLGEFAVSVFFVLSGFFIYASSLSNSSFDYFILRTARLFPALVFVNLVVGAFIAPILRGSLGSSQEWLGSTGSLNYIFSNSTLMFGLQSQISNVFTDVPYTSVVNGSLWTLPTELRCYFICAILGIFAKKFKNDLAIYLCFSTLLLTYFGSLVNWVNFTSFIPLENLKLFLIFFSGSLATKFLRFDDLRPEFWASGCAIFCILVFHVQRDFAPILFWLVLPLLGSVPLKITRLFEGYSSKDYSYGFYLWAFPVAQLLMNFRLTDSVASLILLGSILTFFCAYISWHYVEKPIMSAARHCISKKGKK